MVLLPGDYTTFCRAFPYENILGVRDMKVS